MKVKGKKQGLPAEESLVFVAEGFKASSKSSERYQGLPGMLTQVSSKVQACYYSFCFSLYVLYGFFRRKSV